MTTLEEIQPVLDLLRNSKGEFEVSPGGFIRHKQAKAPNGFALCPLNFACQLKGRPGLANDETGKFMMFLSLSPLVLVALINAADKVNYDEQVRQALLETLC
jgi:hypothetical protein